MRRGPALFSLRPWAGSAVSMRLGTRTLGGGAAIPIDAAPPSISGHCVMRMTCPPPAEVGLTLPLET